MEGYVGVRLDKSHPLNVFLFTVMEFSKVLDGDTKAMDEKMSETKVLIDAEGGIQEFFQKDLRLGFSVDPLTEQRCAKRSRVS